MPPPRCRRPRPPPSDGIQFLSPPPGVVHKDLGRRVTLAGGIEALIAAMKGDGGADAGGGDSPREVMNGAFDAMALPTMAPLMSSLECGGDGVRRKGGEPRGGATPAAQGTPTTAAARGGSPPKAGGAGGRAAGGGRRDGEGAHGGAGGPPPETAAAAARGRWGLTRRGTGRDGRSSARSTRRP